MAIKKLKLIATGADASRRLDDLLATWLPEALGRPVSRSKGRKLIMAGAVRLNGKPVRIASKILNAGATVEAYIDLAKLFEDAPSRDTTFELTADRILFEDEDLIVVDKPPGLPAQPTVDQNRDNLFSVVQRYLPKRNGGVKPYLGLHHRLDRDTSGAVLFTKTERANAGAAEMFSSRLVVKIYHALTVQAGRPPQKQWTIRNHLGKISPKSKPARYGAVAASSGALAETFFRLISEHRRGLLIEARPRTGRTHQIRVHLAEYGLPILGDDLYGPEVRRLAPRLMLHAAELIFPHPMTRREISVRSEEPEDFRQCLRSL